MSEKRSKYDTDPLDPDYVRQTDEIWGATRGVEPRPTDDVGGGAPTRIMPDRPGATNEPQRAPQTEAPTQRMDEHFSQSYPSINIPPTYNQPPAPYQPSPYQQQPQHQQPAQHQQTYAPPQAGATPSVAMPERMVAGFNVREKWSVMLPYTPFYVGLIFSIIELLMVPRREVRVRFHAAQALALHLAIIVISWLLSGFGRVIGSGFGGVLFGLASFIFLLISMSRVWKGEEHRIGPLNDATQWLNQKFEPRNK